MKLKKHFAHSDILRTHHKITAAVLVVLTLAILLGPVTPAFAAFPGTDVLGQSDFTSGTANTTNLGVPNQYGMHTPQDTVVDSVNHRLFVADSANNRVMVYNLDSSDVPLDYSADFVLGQPDFTSKGANIHQSALVFPAGVTYASASERLFVSDQGNQRIMVFDVSSITNGEDAINVLGQDDFTSNAFGSTMDSLNDPQGIEYDPANNRLFVVDGGNDRVLVFDVAAITDGESAVNILGSGTGISPWTRVFNSGGSFGLSLVVDTINGVIYVGTSTTGTIYRCDTTTDCDEDSDWTTSYDTPETTINSLVIDTISGVLYAGTSSHDIILRCDTTTDCDDAGDWTTSYDGPDDTISSLAVDTTNGVIYAGTSYEGVILRCDTTTDCDDTGDWTTSYDTAESVIPALAVDITNGVIYAGVDTAGIIYRCDTTTDCDDAGDWTTSYDGPDDTISSLAVDTTNGVIYAGSFDSGIIYRCDTTTDCDDAGDWTTSYDTPETGIGSLVVDTTNGVIYAASQGSGGTGYRCDTTTDCDEQSDWTPTFFDATGAISSLAVDTTNGVVYGSYLGNPGGVFRCETSTGCGLPILMDGPKDVAYDVSGNRLFVADTGKNRVLVFDATILVDNEEPYTVLGQANFTSNGVAVTQSGMNAPQGLVFDDNNNRLFVADSGSRVLVFDTAAIANGENAINVLGRDDFVTAGTATSVDGLSTPFGMSYDTLNDHIFVADQNNNRVMVFDVDPAVLVADDAGTDGPPAIDLLGQVDSSGNPDYVAQPADNQTNSVITSVSAQGMSAPLDTAIDLVNHRLFVADSTNNRVLEYDLDTNNLLIDHTADHVLGQEDFASAAPATTRDGLSNPTALAYDATNNRLFVSEGNNHRVVVYDVASITDGENAVNVIGQATYTTNTPATTQSGLSTPFGLTYDSANSRLFVGDYNNSRVMVFDADPAVLVANNALTDGPNAINVLGQTTYLTLTPATTQSGLDLPAALFYHASTSRLFVGDYNNNRIMVFNVAAITNGEPAVNVIGQATYTTNTPATTQSGLNLPDGLAYDTEANRLFVADGANNRVMVFNADSTVLIANNAGTDGPNAVAVLGQDDYVSGSSATTQNGLNFPAGLAYDTASKRLYISDYSNNRVIIDDFVRITSTTIANGFTNMPYSQAIQIEDLYGTMTFSVTAGALPPGLSIDSSTGNVSGTPTTVGSYSFTVQVTDDNGAVGMFVDSQSMTLQVLFGGYSASDALGQLNNDDEPIFTTGDGNNGINGEGFNHSLGVALDPTGHRLFVSDSNNNRVLVFNLNSSNQLDNRWADFVLGQVNFKVAVPGTTQVGMSAPTELFYEGVNNRLFVTDAGNSRVLVFDVAAITNGENAVSVLGQPNFTSSGSGTSASEITNPRAVTVTPDGDTLFMVDAGNRRVLVFDLSDGIDIGEDAVGVYGHTDLVTPTSCSNKSLTDGCFDDPRGIATDGSLLYVADPTSTIFAFDVTAYCPDSCPGLAPTVHKIGGGPATSQHQLRFPRGLTYDASNERLFVSDTGNNRVMVFDVADITDFEDAVNVLGQTDFDSNDAGLTQNTLDAAWATAYDPVSGGLFVSDSNNNRVMVFDADPAVLIADDSGTDGPDAVDLLGQMNGSDPFYTSIGANNTPNAHGLNTPRGTALDEVHHRLFVMEYANNRVMVFNLDANNDLIDHTADKVLGQPDFKTIAPGTTQSTLSGPFGMTYDATNDRLFVGDYNNNRVMVFDTTSITNGENAVNVIGQSDFVTPDAATTQSGLWGPDNIAYDSTNKRLFVSDYNNSRVMVFNADPAVLIANTPATDGPLAINVIGEDDYVTAAYVTTQDGLGGPDGLAYDATGKRLFVGDPANNRVIVYNVDPAVLIPNNAGTNGPDAINVLGQTDYTAPGATTTQSGLSAPDDLIYDSATNQLFVADYGNSRVMVFDVATIVDGENALSVLGVADFDSAGGGPTQSGLSGPDGLAYDAGNNRLFISDVGNNRVMVFDFVRITTPDSLPAGTAGTPYSQAINTTNEQGTVGFSVVSGALPPGLSLGSITGTPTTAGSYTFTVRASDDNGAIGSFVDDQSYTIVIAAGSTPTPTPGGGGGGGSPGGPPMPPVVGTPVATPSTSPVASASPSPIVSSTPSPTPFPSVSPIPLIITPTPTSTPVSTPSPSSPIPTTINPSPAPSSSPSIPTGILQSIGGAVSGIVSSIVEPVLLIANAIADVCGDSAVQATSCGAAAATAATAAAGLAAVLAQNQVVASSHWLFQVVGLRRKTRVWGVIYDSATKHPIPFAKVMLSDASGRLLETRFADRDGRYGFLASPQSLHQDKMSVSIRVEKQGYRFPSRTVTANTDAIVYDRLYHGGALTISKDTVFNFNIPIDPTVAARATLSGRSISLLSTLGDRLLNALFYVGLITVPWSAYRNPSTVNLVILIVFFAANAFRLLVVYRPYATIVDAKTGKPMAFALVTLNDAAGNRIAFTVSDEYGRCILSGPRGSAYDIIAYTPANISPPRTIHQHLSRLTGRGWVTGRVRV